MILIDENLSDKLARSLVDLFPAISILTADSDLKTLASQLGTPPKVIQIVECNFSTRQAEDLLRREAIRISEFLTADQSVLLLKRSP